MDITIRKVRWSVFHRTLNVYIPGCKAQLVVAHCQRFITGRQASSINFNRIRQENFVYVDIKGDVTFKRLRIHTRRFHALPVK